LFINALADAHLVVSAHAYCFDRCEPIDAVGGHYLGDDTAAVVCGLGERSCFPRDYLIVRTVVRGELVASTQNVLAAVYHRADIGDIDAALCPRRWEGVFLLLPRDGDR